MWVYARCWCLWLWPIYLDYFCPCKEYNHAWNYLLCTQVSFTGGRNSPTFGLLQNIDDGELVCRLVNRECQTNVLVFLRLLRSILHILTSSRHCNICSFLAYYLQKHHSKDKRIAQKLYQEWIIYFFECCADCRLFYRLIS